MVGGSAGSLDALSELAAGLRADFPAPILVAVHLRAGRASALAKILDRAGPLPARMARDLDPLEAGTILVGPPDRHLLVEPERVRVMQGPRVNGYCPSVDVLFLSAARSHGAGAIGVVLSGALTDGSLGLRAIERRGGGAVVQADPLHEGMTTSALANVRADAVARFERESAEAAEQAQTIRSLLERTPERRAERDRTV